MCIEKNGKFLKAIVIKLMRIILIRMAQLAYDNNFSFIGY